MAHTLCIFLIASTGGIVAQSGVILQKLGFVLIYYRATEILSESCLTWLLVDQHSTLFWNL